MTEDEAKQRWCPILGLCGAQFFAGKGDMGGSGQRNCIGSACMMWRWDVKRLTGLMGGDPEVSCVSGYCGLAGKP